MPDDAFMIERMLEDLDGMVESMTERLGGIKAERKKLDAEEARLNKELVAAHEILLNSRRVVAKALGKRTRLERVG